MSNRRRWACTVKVRPICPKHGDTMNAGSSQAMTYYYCRVAGCRHSDKAGRFYKPVNESSKDSGQSG
jgi:hypothetical protein